MDDVVPCGFCGATLAGRPFVVCARCDVPLHQDCFAEGRKCPAFGCGSIEVLDAAQALYRPAPPALQPAAAPGAPSLEERRRELRRAEEKLARDKSTHLFRALPLTLVGGALLLSQVGARPSWPTFIGLLLLVVNGFWWSGDVGRLRQRHGWVQEERERLEREQKR